MPLLTPLHYPYTPNTSNPYSAEVQRAKEIFFAEVDNQEGWEGALIPCSTRLLLKQKCTTDQGEKDDVKLEKKAGQASGSGMPMVRPEKSDRALQEQEQEAEIDDAKKAK